ncbi:MAG: GGDEF domain-containing protein [Candidatus Eisenbacteria sp.]|nr:GGDEF domain-containing protein [Candidatus Eisenbacteria bacterium]
MIKWFMRLFTEQSRSHAGSAQLRKPPQGWDPSQLLAGSLTQTVIGLLKLAQKHAINCPSLHPGFFKGEIHKIVDRYQDPLSPPEEDSLRKRSIELIASQRELEKEYIGDKEEELKTIIGLIAGEIEGAGKENQAFAADMTQSVQKLGQAVEVEDIRQIRERISHAVTSISRHLELRKKRDEDRIRNLEDQVGILQAKLDFTTVESRMDPLTSLYDRRAFDDRIRTEVSLAQRLQKPLSLALIDIDQFKLANETYGQKVCDDVLVELANRLIKGFFRKTDFIARYGGEEFAVLLCQAPMDAAFKAANGVRDGLIKHPISTQAGEVTITISAGVTQCAPGEQTEEFIARADEALRQAKEEGCNRVVAADPPAGRRAA